MGDRLASGRFAPGNAGGPGRPRRPEDVDYVARLRAAVDGEAWAAIVRKAIEQAAAGLAARCKGVMRFMSIPHQEPELCKPEELREVALEECIPLPLGASNRLPAPM